MARTKRTSKVLEQAQRRAASLASIDQVLDLGNGLTAAAYNTAITTAQTLLTEYNQALSTVDDRLNALVAAEKRLQDLSERMLAGVAARYGKDSSQYEQAGGVRKSERKAPSRKAKASIDKS
jgi:hypothetical protein